MGRGCEKKKGPERNGTLGKPSGARRAGRAKNGNRQIKSLQVSFSFHQQEILCSSSLVIKKKIFGSKTEKKEKKKKKVKS